MEKLNVKRGSHYRGDCPACSGSHTFIVSNDAGNLLYHCFKASCKVKGKVPTGVKLFDAKEFLMDKVEQQVKPLLLESCVGFDPNVKAYPHAMEYIAENNCLEYFNLYPNAFYYDNVQNRVVFVSYETINSFNLATGRALDKGVQPKWYKYVACSASFFIAYATNAPPLDNTVYICEDCASAGSLSRLNSALALCGTSWKVEALVERLELLGVRNIVVCLDKDAQELALKLRRDLKAFGSFSKVSVVNLSNDAKYLTKEQLQKELG